jgi:hypothetical protein
MNISILYYHIVGALNVLQLHEAKSLLKIFDSYNEG